MPNMNAVRIHTYGGPDVLTYEEAPRPTPAANEVLIRVSATSVNPFDCAVRAGYLAGYFNHTLPLILGTDVSGVVEEVGQDVTAFRPGDAVYTRTGVFRDGAYAEYAVAAESDVAIRPHSLGAIASAALPHVSLTAWQALFEVAELSAGQTVLIHGAAGGVGHVAVQLAKWRGARVIGTTSQHADFLAELGTDEIIDYTAVAFEEVASNVDVVLDTVGGEVQRRSCMVLKPGGMLVSIVQAPSEEMAAEFDVRTAMVAATPPIGETLTTIAELVDSGTLAPYVSAVLPLQEVQRAHAMVEERHTCGKVILEVAGSDSGSS